MRNVLTRRPPHHAFAIRRSGAYAEATRRFRPHEAPKAFVAAPKPAPAPGKGR